MDADPTSAARPGYGRAVPTGRPTKQQLADAYDRTLPDLVAPGLRVLLVGINPSLWSGWSGYHFGRPSNRLWTTLHESGLTPRRLAPEDTAELLAAGIGITNLVARATARADELADDEIRAGVPGLRELVRQWRPRAVAVLGVTAFRVAFARPKAVVGAQPESLEGSLLWVLPNPSGLNAHYQQPALTAEYAALRAALDDEGA
jgi:TDG/mug DNA glycosylase family protein